MIKKILIFTATLIFYLLPQTVANAGSLGRAFEDSFGASTQRASPGSYTTGSRAIHSGGYVRLRVGVKSAPNPITIQPPSFKGGCNGFDIFGGSFSMIQADELMEWFSAVVQNGTGVLANYLFQTYLQETCSVCAEVMNGLYAMQDMMNQTMQDSCSTATALIDGMTSGGEGNAWNAYKEGVVQSSVQFGNALTRKTDALDAKKKAEADIGDASQSFDDPDDEWMSAKGGNMLMNAIDRGGLVEYFKARFNVTTLTREQVYAYLSGMFGSRITDVKGVSDIVMNEYPAFITLQNFVDGVDNINNHVANIHCESSDPRCLEPKEEKFSDVFDTLEPMTKKMDCIMLGKYKDVACGATGGLLAKLGRDTDDGVTSKFTPEEEVFMKGFGVMPIMGLLSQMGSSETLKEAAYSCFQERFVFEAAYAEFDRASFVLMNALKGLPVKGNAKDERNKYIGSVIKAKGAIVEEFRGIEDSANKECQLEHIKSFNEIQTMFQNTQK